MQNTEFFRSLLQLGEDWEVERVTTDHGLQQIDVYLRYVRPLAPSPTSGERCAIYDYREERQWRHLDTMQYKTYLHARVPRVRLPNGEVVTITVPWADTHSRLTWLFEAWGIEMLLALQNQSRAAGMLRISFDQIHRIMDRAVARGLAVRRAQPPTPPRRLAIDEKCYHRPHQFVTIVSNPETGAVIAVEQGRSREAAMAAVRAAVPLTSRAAVTAVAMDMAAVYERVVHALLPGADVVHDKFHLFQHLTNAIDRTRRQEVRLQPLLKHSRTLMLKNDEHRNDQDRNHFNQVNARNMKTAQAWRVRENFKAMYDTCSSVTEAIRYFLAWRDHAVSLNLRSVNSVIRSFDQHLYGIVSYFRHRITNARAEQLNSKIALLIRIARGYKTAPRLINAIYFYLGGLNLLPQNIQ